MITITSETGHDKINVIDEEIILNGPPSNLRGRIQLENKQDDLLRVKTLALVDKNKKRVKDHGRDSIRMTCRVRPGEKKLQSISHRLPASTPPGTYESFLQVGEKLLKTKMIVQPAIEIDLHPNHFTLQDSSPGKQHTVYLTLTNMGNLSFQVPELKHAGSMDMDLFCRAFGFGFRKNGADGLVDSLDEVARNIRENLADWADVSVKEHGKIVEPGESIILTLKLKNPKNSDSNRDYTVDLRFWNKKLSFVIKSHVEKNKKSRNGKTK
jgi:hypothetical protein